MEIIMDLHTHSLASVHAYSTITENARAAKKRGLQIMGMSDHGYGMPNTTNPDFWVNLKALPDYLEGIRLLKGVEANIYNHEGLVLEEDLFNKVDYVIASIHGNIYDFNGQGIEDFTEATIHALERYPEINILGHPDDSRYPLDYRRVIRAAIKNKVALEVNNSSLRSTNARENAEENMRKYLPMCAEMGCRIIINSDAHMHDSVGDFTLARKILHEINFPKELIINDSWEKLEDLIGLKL